MHFFTEPEKLNPQMQDSYGPVMNDIANKYHTGSLFTCNQDAKLFACQSGMMIVQPHIGQDGNVDPTLVNIILKPNSGLEIPFSSVKYYIYRGVDINSFLLGTNVVPASTLSTEFINKFWDNWDNLINNLNEQDANSQSTTTTQLPFPNTFGYEDISLPEALASTTLVEEIYNSEESDNPLVRKFQAIKVEEGEWIGNICAGVNFIFEVIIDTDHLVIDLAYVRKFQNVIDVSLLGNITAEEKFIIKAEREKILNYIDPAALFGMFYESGINVSNYQNSNRSSILKKGAELYTEILEKFYTKNRVYLDIRSERGYSYNYYNNYGDEDGNIIKALRKEENLTAQVRSTIIVTPSYNYHNYNNWPVFCIDTITGSEAGIENSTYNHIEIALRVDDNLKPVLFAENPNVLLQNTNSYFIDEKELVEENNTNWTKKITIQYPNYNDSAIKLDIANYVKLQYFRKSDNILSPNTVLKSGNYLDAVFSGISSSIVTIPSVFKNDKKVKKHFINAGDDDFQYVSENNLTANESEVLFLTYNDFSLKKSTNTYPVINLSHFESQSISENYILPKNIIYNKWQANDGSNNIAILEIVGYNKQDSIATPMEDIFMLGLTKEEWEALNAIPNVSNLHQKYLYFEDASNTTDTITGLAYTKYRLKVQGLDNKGEVIIAAPSSDISVYCSSPNLLASHEFAYNTIIPSNDLSDPAIYNEGYHVCRFDYDGNDAIVTSLFPQGIVEIEDYQETYQRQKAGIIGEIHYPVDSINSDIISARKDSYPLIVIIHGNGQRYSDYRTLATHLAKNGFITCSISCLIKGCTSFTLFPYPNNNNIYYTYDAEDTMYIYNNNPNIDITYLKYQKLSTAKYKAYDLSTGAGIDLLSWKKGEDFIIKEVNGIPSEIEIQFHIGKHDMNPVGRANMLYPHLQIIKNKFNGKVKNEIGLLGHSRGGQAVIRNAKDINNKALGNLKNIKAIISLAPTDILGFGEENLIENIPYQVIYGSMDGDVAGYINKQISAFPNPTPKPALSNANSGFSLYDRANNSSEKFMSFIYGATHNGFTTNNSDYKTMIYTKFSNKLMTAPQQKTILKGLVNAFFRKYIKGEAIWSDILNENKMPLSMPNNKIYNQYRDMRTDNHLSIIDLQRENNIGLSDGQVSLNRNANSDKLKIGVLLTLDPQTPHDTKGLQVEWQKKDILTFHIDSQGKDIETFTNLSFRIGYSVKLSDVESPDVESPDVESPDVEDSLSFDNKNKLLLEKIVHAYKYDENTEKMKLQPSKVYDEPISTNESYSSLDDLAIKLIDTNGNGRSINMKELYKHIPIPDSRENRVLYEILDNKGTENDYTDDSIQYIYNNFTKSSMMTIRIPLSQYRNNNIDLKKIKEIVFTFPSIGSGNIIMNDIEFTK